MVSKFKIRNRIRSPNDNKLKGGVCREPILNQVVLISDVIEKALKVPSKRNTPVEITALVKFLKYIKTITAKRIFAI